MASAWPECRGTLHAARRDSRVSPGVTSTSTARQVRRSEQSNLIEVSVVRGVSTRVTCEEVRAVPIVFNRFTEHRTAIQRIINTNESHSATAAAPSGAADRPRNRMQSQRPTAHARRTAWITRTCSSMRMAASGVHKAPYPSSLSTAITGSARHMHAPTRPLAKPVPHHRSCNQQPPPYVPTLLA